jgi:hypothetical protein
MAIQPNPIALQSGGRILLNPAVLFYRAIFLLWSARLDAHSARAVDAAGLQ